MIPRGLPVSFRRVGGIRFLKIGRLTVSWSISRAPAFRPIPIHLLPVVVDMPAPDMAAIHAARARRGILS